MAPTRDDLLGWLAGNEVPGLPPNIDPTRRVVLPPRINEGQRSGLPQPVLICRGCGNEIDEAVCWCGEYIKSHYTYHEHTPVPMGCDCLRSDQPLLPRSRPRREGWWMGPKEGPRDWWMDPCLAEQPSKS
jgi:hypothetical protein